MMSVEWRFTLMFLASLSLAAAGSAGGTEEFAPVLEAQGAVALPAPARTDATVTDTTAQAGVASEPAVQVQPPPQSEPVVQVQPEAAVQPPVPSGVPGETPTPTAAATDQAPQPEAASGPAAQPEMAGGVAEEPAAEAVAEQQAVVQAPLLLPAPPPASLQTLVDERRDQLREGRYAPFDAMRGSYGYPSPSMAGYDLTMDGYRDAMRQIHRRQRDYSQSRHDSWMDAMCPWSKPQRDRVRMRSYLQQMRQLDRQEARDAWLTRRPWAFAGTAPW